MRKIIMILLLMNSYILVKAQEKYWVFTYFKDNGKDGLHMAYSTDGYNWNALNKDKSLLKPTAGNDKLMRDPCVIRGADGLFHLVWTVSWGERTIGYATSKDLIHWSDQKIIPVMEKDTTTLNAWAPEITYDTKSKKYMIYWASTVPDKFPKTGVKADGKYNHRMYYLLTKDFVKFSKVKLLYDKNFSVIDASIVKKGEQYIMFLKNENDAPIEKNIRIATSNKMTKDYSEASAPITGKYWAEGPTVLIKDNTWIVYFDKYTQHKYGAVASTDLKNWIDVSENINVPKNLRHGTILEITKNEFDQLMAFESSNN